MDPTSQTAKLFDPSGTQKSFTDTSINTSSSITPTKDTDGTVTGQIGRYYANIALIAATSTPGKWWIEVTETWEAVTKVIKIYFTINGSGDGADIVADVTSVYANTSDVVRWLYRNNVAIDSNTPFSDVDMQLYLRRAEDKIDTHLGRTFKAQVRKVAPDGSGILCDVFFNRLSFSLVDYLASFKVPIGPIQSIIKLEIMTGSPGYTDLTSNINNENRPNGIWFDPNGVEVFLGRGMSLPVIFKNGVRIQYYAGLGFNQNVPIPGEIVTATTKLAAAELLESEWWALKLPEGSGRSPRDMAADFRAQGYSELEYGRSFVWA